MFFAAGGIAPMTLNAHLAKWLPPAAKIIAAATFALLASPAIPAEGATKMGSGQAAFNNQCRTCHSVKEGDNRLGPSLHGIVGAKAGAGSGYASYSQAMKTAGVQWDEATLDRFIADPEAVIPNNNMKPFKGIPDAAVRKAIVEYLKSGA
jgi:cytochrome c